VGVGSTPTCSLPPPHLDAVGEMHPGNYICYGVMQPQLGALTLPMPLPIPSTTGNYIYYDVMQQLLGACTAEQVRVRVKVRGRAS